MREKNDWHMLCRERREISLTVLLVNCHDVKVRIFDQWISRQTGIKSPFGRLGSFSSHMARCIYSSLDPVSFQFKLINWSATTAAAKIDLSSDTSFWILWPILKELNSRKGNILGKDPPPISLLHTTLWKLTLSLSEKVSQPQFHAKERR